MISIGIILLLGVLIVVLAAVAPVPPPIGTLGWVALVKEAAPEHPLLWPDVWSESYRPTLF